MSTPTSALRPLRLAAPGALRARPGPQPGGRRQGPAFPSPQQPRRPAALPGKRPLPPAGRRRAEAREAAPSPPGRSVPSGPPRCRRGSAGLAGAGGPGFPGLCPRPPRLTWAAPSAAAPHMPPRPLTPLPFVVLPPPSLLLLPSSEARCRKAARCRKGACRNSPLLPPPPRRAAGRAGPGAVSFKRAPSRGSRAGAEPGHPGLGSRSCRGCPPLAGECRRPPWGGEGGTWGHEGGGAAQGYSAPSPAEPPRSASVPPYTERGTRGRPGHTGPLACGAGRVGRSRPQRGLREVVCRGLASPRVPELVRLLPSTQRAVRTCRGGDPASCR